MDISSVNIRSGPGTSYSIVTSLTNGTKVTRIKKAVATANGYTWDKIVLENGKIGYVATNYLVIVSSGDGYAKYEIHDDIKVIKAYLKYSTNYYTGNVDEEYNNGLIGAVEEFQKAKKLAIQDGSLNSTTLTAMGFSMNTNGRVSQNSFYNTYLSIAKQYMKGDYLDDAKDNEGNPDPNTYIYTLDNPSFDKDYREKKTEGDEEWNTMSSTDFASKETYLRETLRKVKHAASLYSSSLPNASAALGHFVDENNFGKPLTFSDIESIFTVSDGMTALYRNTINRNMRAAEHVTTYVNTATYSMEYFTGAETGFSLHKNHLDWFMAVNGFVFGSHGQVDKNGTKYTMKLVIDVRDYYDWADKDEDPMTFPLYVDTVETIDGNMTILETVNEVTLNELNKAGLGKNFESNGTITLNISWTKGQTYDDIKGQI